MAVDCVHGLRRSSTLLGCLHEALPQCRDGAARDEHGHIWIKGRVDSE